MFRSPAHTEPLDQHRLAAHLAGEGMQLALEQAPRMFAGGLGNWNYLVEVDGLPYVLRRPPAGPLPVGANDMAREYRILSRLHRGFDLAPYSPLFCGDPSVIGAPFLLIEYREGQVIRGELPGGLLESEAQRRAFSERVIDVLVQLHAVDPRDVDLQDLGRPAGMVERQARNWTLRARDAFGGALPPSLQSLAVWLAGPAPPPQRTTLLHSDFKFDNLIVAAPGSGEPRALIDWDMGTLGDPLLDLATLVSYWIEPGDAAPVQLLGQMPTTLPGFPTRNEVLELYARRSGLDLSNFRYYRVLALFKLCVVFQQLHRRHVRGEFKAAGAASFGRLTEGLIDFATHAFATERY